MNKFELDLHEVRHADVPREVDKFIGSHLMSGSKSVVIITGKSDPMKAIVGNTLADYEIEFKENWGNVGELIVDLS
jgi:hypothetical protein